jgi:hypothetical protein
MRFLRVRRADCGGAVMRQDLIDAFAAQIVDAWEALKETERPAKPRPIVPAGPGGPTKPVPHTPCAQARERQK